MARARHAIERVRDTAHATFERGACVFVKRIAMSSAYADVVGVEIFDRLQRARQFGRDRNALNHICMVEQLLHNSRRRVLNEFRTLRAAFCF